MARNYRNCFLGADSRPYFKNVCDTGLLDPQRFHDPDAEIGDRVLVLKFWYALPKVEPKRGQIIVFKYPVDPRRDFVKRVIGLPGDKVEMKNGTVYINDKELFEPYVKNTDTFNMDSLVVPEKSYFCLGDNRPNSQDGRFWGFVPRDFIRGPAIFRYWPLSRIGLLD